MCLDELRIFQKVENTVRLQTVREREGKDQKIPDYFQNHLSKINNFIHNSRLFTKYN